jgi:hypothetical protein
MFLQHPAKLAKLLCSNLPRLVSLAATMQHFGSRAQDLATILAASRPLTDTASATSTIAAPATAQTHSHKL